jgi:hypothetical protein
MGVFFYGFPHAISAPLVFTFALTLPLAPALPQKLFCAFNITLASLKMPIVLGAVLFSRQLC